MFLNPEAIVSFCELKPGMKVADLGAGSGAYSIAAAQKVSPNGKVYALEVQKDMIVRLKNDIPRPLQATIECVWANIEKIGGTKLAQESIDYALVSNVFFQIEHKDGFLKELLRIVNRGGHVLFIDWSESFGGMGPDVSSVVTKQTALDMCAKYGFTLEKEIPAGDHHYGLILVRGSAASAK
jgi:ubiquinone/menaquinone biosynthesis C-methylase UbiE